MLTIYLVLPPITKHVRRANHHGLRLACCDTTRWHHTNDRAKPGTDDTDGDKGDEDGKSALAKEEEIVKDDVGFVDKAASDTSGGGGGGGSAGGKRTESITNTQGDVSTPQPAWTAKSEPDKAETDSSTSGAGRSSEDGLMDGSGAPDVGDDWPAEAVVAVDNPAWDSDDALADAYQANAEVGSSTKRFASSPGDRAKKRAVGERVTEGASDGEKATGSEDVSTSAGTRAETTSLEVVDSR